MHSTDTNLPSWPDVQPGGDRPKNQSTGATTGIWMGSNIVHSTMHNIHGAEE